ncbi:MAG: hypothetical protein AAF587_26350 [Bacteroidota bacterium]
MIKKTIMITLGIVFSLFVIYWLFFKPYHSDSKILIPEGFIGPAVIQFGQANGQDALTKRGIRVFKISDQGIFITNAPHYTDRLGYDFYYVDQVGNEQKVEMEEKVYLSKRLF